MQRDLAHARMLIDARFAACPRRRVLLAGKSAGRPFSYFEELAGLLALRSGGRGSIGCPGPWIDAAYTRAALVRHDELVVHAHADAELCVHAGRSRVTGNDFM